MIGLFDIDWKFKFGETDRVSITCEGKPHAIDGVRELAKYILSLDDYQLEQCLDIENSKENTEATLKKVIMYMKESLKSDVDYKKIIKEGLFIATGNKEE